MFHLCHDDKYTHNERYGLQRRTKPRQLRTTAPTRILRQVKEQAGRALTTRGRRRDGGGSDAESAQRSRLHASLQPSMSPSSNAMASRYFARLRISNEVSLSKRDRSALCSRSARFTFEAIGSSRSART